MKKYLIFLSIFLLFLNVGFSYEYNNTYSDLYLENVGWCAGLEVTFTIYNQSEYDEKEDLEDDLCDEGEDPDEDRCFGGFETFKNAEVKIYDGPLDNLDLLLDTKLGSTNEFKFTFPRPDQYLIEVLPTGKFNDYYEPLFYVENCPWANDITELYLENKSYGYSTQEVTIKLEETDSKIETDFTVKRIFNLNVMGLPTLEGVKKTVQIMENEVNFTSMDLEINVSLDLNDENQVYKYNSETKTWNIVESQIITNKVILENIEFGIYAITSKEVIVEEPIVEEVVQEEIQEEVLNNGQEEETQTQQEPVVEQEEKTSVLSKFETKHFYYGGVGLLLLLVFFYLVTHKIDFNKMYHKEEVKLDSSSQHLENLTDIKKRTKEYVQRYKVQYSKDQIYRALKQANIPTDIIDHVFKDEY